VKGHSANRLLILTLLALAIGGACLAVQGPLPGDVGATRRLQSLFGNAPRWAEWLTDTAKPPMVIATLGVGAGLAWLAARWRSALSVPLAFGIAWLIDKGLRAVIFSPRPSALVAVASASSSSGLPSTFGLVYGSIFGVVVFAAASGKSALGLRALALALIFAGAAARVVLGGHWSSQMVASVLLSLLAAAAASAVVVRFLTKEGAR